MMLDFLKDKKFVAIICITAIEITALVCGVNGGYFALAVGAVAGIAGYAIGKDKS